VIVIRKLTTARGSYGRECRSKEKGQKRKKSGKGSHRDRKLQIGAGRDLTTPIAPSKFFFVKSFTKSV
jgi:hypothetical protein